MSSSASHAPGVADIPAPPAVLTGPLTDMPTQFEFADIEEAVYSWWEDAGLFRPCAENGKDPFVICMPPPNVTGGLHMGHALGTALQDILTRFHRMRGRPTLFLPGTDHAGIATQVEIEKHLAFEGLTRTGIGREACLKKAWEWKEEKEEYICRQMRRIGASCDWGRHRFTLEEDLSKAVNEAFVRLYELGHIYSGNYMVNWCPSLMTAVSDLEVETVEEHGKMYFLKYHLAGSEFDGEFIRVATPRPETIFADAALGVHPHDLRFEKYIGHNVVVPIVGREIPVIGDTHVDRYFGSGVLKITPAHDMLGFALGMKHNLPIINIMNKDGSINDCAGPDYKGRDRFQVGQMVWEYIEIAGLKVKVEPYVNLVPRRRGGGEIIERLISTQWFVRVTPFLRPAREAVGGGQIRILPDHFERVYYKWLDEIYDWCISRQLWWGHRIPVWHVVEHPGKFIVSRSEEEARVKADAEYGSGVSLQQDPDVLDTWFSSALWPFATMGWPNEDTSDMKNFHPGSVLETGYDVLFLWVARMIMMSVGLTGKIPFNTVYLHGLICDGRGQKMSKTLGNFVDPRLLMAMYGTDSVRYSLVMGTTPGQDVSLSTDKMKVSMNFVNKVWNVCRFALTNLEDISEDERRELASVAVAGFGKQESVSSMPLAERYIVSKVHLLVESGTSGLEALEFCDVGRRIYEFMWDEFVDWYVEEAKIRLDGDDAEAAKTARVTLVYVLDTCLRLMHPFLPFVTEALWQRFPRDATVEAALITASWPAGGFVDDDAIRRFERVQALVRSVRIARMEHHVIPGERIPLKVSADAISAKDISNEAALVCLLAKIDADRLTVDVADKDSKASTTEADGSSIRLPVGDSLEATLPLKGIVDVDKARALLEEQLGETQKGLEDVRKKLNTRKFVRKASAKALAEARSAVTELEEKVAALNLRVEEVEALRESS